MLRDIGWAHWDPIGLLGPDETWDGELFADEYDRYLIVAAGQLRRGAPEEEVVQYLLEIECYHMGLGERHSRAEQVEKVAREIKDSKTLWNHDD